MSPSSPVPAPRPLLVPSLACVLATAVAAQCETAVLTPEGVLAQDEYSASLDLDGNRLVAGAYADASLPSNVGAAYVFERTAAGWGLHSKLAVDAPGELGESVAVDGEWIACGAPRTMNDAGRVEVFRRVGDAWQPWQTLTDPEALGAARFGEDVALDGDHLLVGAAPTNSSTPARVLAYELQGDAWVFTQVVSPPDGSGSFGFELELDGDLALARDLDLRQVWVLERGPGGWALGPELVPTLQGGTAFGRALSLSGGVAVVGNVANPGGPIDGLAVVFEEVAGVWTETDTLSRPGVPNFGVGVATDGQRLYVSDHHDSDVVPNAGSVYAYERQGGDWVDLGEFQAAIPRAFDALGTNLRLDGDTLATSAQGMPFVPGKLGKVHVFSTHAVPGQPLSSCPGALSLAVGGEQRFELDAGAQHAGSLYVLVGTTAGTSPGIALGTQVLPLNWSDYLALTLSSPNSHIAGSLGVLDLQGRASAIATFPAGLNPALTAVPFDHAFVVLEGDIAFVSNAVPLVLEP